MNPKFTKIVFTLSLTVFFFSPNLRASCSMSTEIIGDCLVSNGDIFTLTSRPECGYDKYKEFSKVDANQSLGAKDNTKLKQTTYQFERNIVELPDLVTKGINDIWEDLHFKEGVIYEMPGQTRAAKEIEIKRINNEARAKSVDGGKVYVVEKGKKRQLIGSLSCKIANE